MIIGEVLGILGILYVFWVFCSSVGEFWVLGAVCPVLFCQKKSVLVFVVFFYYRVGSGGGAVLVLVRFCIKRFKVMF